MESDRTRESAAALWEAAYLEFETEAEEVAKFTSRLRRMGIEGDRRATVLDLFAGRANGLRALESIGFGRAFAVDRAFSLLSRATARSRLCAADVRHLPFRSGSIDLVVVQGGLHHLETLPADLHATLGEITRVLRSGGRVAIVEPSLTPFLALVHAVCRVGLARRLSRRVRALATMIEHERETYEAWLSQGELVTASLASSFEPAVMRRRLGKLYFVGVKR
jgi:ubiquinone/menaquinone biosynthesis C-methylase UbiE